MSEETKAGSELSEPVRAIQVGDRVRTGVYVCNEWKPMSLGIVVSQSNDGTISRVDVMSLHGGAPWIHMVQTNHLRRETQLRS